MNTIIQICNSTTDLTAKLFELYYDGNLNKKHDFTLIYSFLLPDFQLNIIVLGGGNIQFKIK